VSHCIDASCQECRLAPVEDLLDDLLDPREDSPFPPDASLPRYTVSYMIAPPDDLTHADLVAAVRQKHEAQLAHALGFEEFALRFRLPHDAALLRACVERHEALGREVVVKSKPGDATLLCVYHRPMALALLDPNAVLAGLRDSDGDEREVA
jgi:hypothetical protein